MKESAARLMLQAYFIRLATLTITGCATLAQAQPQNYPVRPVRLISVNAAGGGADTVARVISPRLIEALGQQIVIDNRPGAGGGIGAEITARSAPDGYTVMLGSIGTLAVNVSLSKGLGYHPIRDFAPVTFATSAGNVLVLHPAVTAKTVQDLIALARAQPGKLTYGSSGAGNTGHLAGELFKSMARVEIVHVPYRGGAPVMLDLLAGQVQLVFASTPTAIPQIKAGRISALAVTTARRSAAMPELPTMAEMGLPGFEVDNWYGIVVPAKTPPAIIHRLNAELVTILNLPDIKQTLFRQGLETAPGTPEAFGAYMRAEFSKWAKLIAEVGLTAN